MKAPCKNFWESLHYALNGLKLSSQEPHFRLMLVCALVAVIAAILLGISSSRMVNINSINLFQNIYGENIKRYPCF